MTAPILSVAPTATSASGSPATAAAGASPSEPRAEALLAALFDAALDAALGDVSANVGSGRESAPAEPGRTRNEPRPEDRAEDPAAPPPMPPDTSAQAASDALLVLAGLAMPAVAAVIPAATRASTPVAVAEPGAIARGPAAIAERPREMPTPAESPDSAAPASAAPVPIDTASPSSGATPPRASPDSPAPFETAEHDATTAAVTSAADAQVPPPTGGPPPVAGPPSAPTLTISAPIDSAAFAPALADEVVHLLQIRADRVELQVRPIELGPIDLAVRFDGREAHLVVHAVQADARTALENALPGLRALLADAGIALGGASIHDGRASDGGERALRGDASPRLRADAPVAAPATVWTRRAGAGLIDTYA